MSDKPYSAVPFLRVDGTEAFHVRGLGLHGTGVIPRRGGGMTRLDAEDLADLLNAAFVQGQIAEQRTMQAHIRRAMLAAPARAPQ